MRQDEIRDASKHAHSLEHCAVNCIAPSSVGDVKPEHVGERELSEVLDDGKVYLPFRLSPPHAASLIAGTTVILPFSTM